MAVNPNGIIKGFSILKYKPMSDRYIMALYTYCLSARKVVALEDIELEGLSEAELSMVKLESVREVLFQALLLDDVKFEDGKMYAELYSIYIL